MNQEPKKKGTGPGGGTAILACEGCARQHEELENSIMLYPNKPNRLLIYEYARHLEQLAAALRQSRRGWLG